MIQEWFEMKELVGVGGLPTTVQGITKKAKLENWQRRRVAGVKGNVFEYYVGDMPPAVQQALGFAQPLEKTMDKPVPLKSHSLPELPIEQAINEAEQALQALQRAIERQKPKNNPILDGQPLKVEEMTVIRNYRKTDDRGREAILTLSFSMLGFTTNTTSDNDKDEAIAKAANGS
ncbi:DNA-binding protein [Gallibacterium sp. AGMB14963]|uniref:DNA-binding protein n=1 Tax=Gallibacterium faecale TaxID=3019086 RepID=UPI0022F14A1F|nr:DNA-binding protein [Gallibacterium sp. AGMB14963]MDA3977932.1 DNA-binding protein [Gallibacterium sp. AGMB14963]